MTTAACGALPSAHLRAGEEPIDGTGTTLGDFWSWSMSDLRTNTTRSVLAEYLVARAVGAAGRPRVEWDAYDVETPEGLRLEVKSGAYLQAWEQTRLSTVTFTGLRARTWTAEAGYSDGSSYNADGYVFAVLTAIEHGTYDALDVDQWSFWILPVEVVAATGQSSMRLSRVQALAGAPVDFGGLAAAIRRTVRPSASASFS